MFQASVDGEAFDKEAWGQYFRPAGMSASTGDPNSGIVDDEAPVRAAPARQAVQNDEDTKPAAKTSDSKAEDILAMIRNRQKQQ
jgi:hypothetical protein